MAKNGKSAGKKQPNRTVPVVEYQLLLFVTGATPNSVRAVANVKKICDDHLAGRYSLEVIDVYRQKEIAAQFNLIALPMLIRKAPSPEKKVIGDFSDVDRVLSILNII